MHKYLILLLCKSCGYFLKYVVLFESSSLIELCSGQPFFSQRRIACYQKDEYESGWIYRKGVEDESIDKVFERERE